MGSMGWVQWDDVVVVVRGPSETIVRSAAAGFARTDKPFRRLTHSLTAAADKFTSQGLNPRLIMTLLRYQPRLGCVYLRMVRM
jgi:hypothetical protein